jgi:hypothetical protein
VNEEDEAMSGTYSDADARRLGLLDPTSGTAQSKARAALPRLESLEGKRIGLLDNSKTNAAALLAQVGQALVRDHGAAQLIARGKLIYSRIAPAELIEELVAGCDAVLTAIGD